MFFMSQIQYKVFSCEKQLNKRLCLSVRWSVDPLVRPLVRGSDTRFSKTANSSKFNIIQQNSGLFATIGQVTALFCGLSNVLPQLAWSMALIGMKLLFFWKGTSPLQLVDYKKVQQFFFCIITSKRIKQAESCKVSDCRKFFCGSRPRCFF